MLRGKRDSSAEQTRLRMDNSFHGDCRHHRLEPALGGEPAAEARARKELGNARAEAAGNDDCIRAVRQRDIASDAAQDQAEAVERCDRETVGAEQRGGPNGLIVARFNRAVLDSRQRLVDIGEPRSRDYPLDRHPAVAFAQPRKNDVLDAVNRGIIYVPALAFDDIVVSLAAQHMCYAKTAPRSDDADHALLRQGNIGATKITKMFTPDLDDGMSDSAEVVDQGYAVDAEPLGHHGRSDDPGIIGELQYFARDGASDGNGCGAGQSAPQLLAERFPCGLQACMIDGLQRDRVT